MAWISLLPKRIPVLPKQISDQYWSVRELFVCDCVGPWPTLLSYPNNMRTTMWWRWYHVEMFFRLLSSTMSCRCLRSSSFCGTSGLDQHSEHNGYRTAAIDLSKLQMQPLLQYGNPRDLPEINALMDWWGRAIEIRGNIFKLWGSRSVVLWLLWQASYRSLEIVI